MMRSASGLQNLTSRRSTLISDVVSRAMFTPQTLNPHAVAVPRERAANLLLAFRARGTSGNAAAGKAAEGVRVFSLLETLTQLTGPCSIAALQLNHDI